MFVLMEKETGGIYDVNSKDKKKTVTVFESEDDATRHMGLLEANDSERELEIMEVDPDIIAMNCVNYDYRFTIIKENQLIIPKGKVTK